jgi:hypothetical protein
MEYQEVIFISKNYQKSLFQMLAIIISLCLRVQFAYVVSALSHFDWTSDFTMKRKRHSVIFLEGKSVSK